MGLHEECSGEGSTAAADLGLEGDGGAIGWLRPEGKGVMLRRGVCL